MKGNKKSKVSKMTVGEYTAYSERVRRRCPRGMKYFCDGTPNPIPTEPYIGIGKCKHFVNGECTFAPIASNR